MRDFNEGQIADLKSFANVVGNSNVKQPDSGQENKTAVDQSVTVATGDGGHFTYKNKRDVPYCYR
jgi:hypothetical protein